MITTNEIVEQFVHSLYHPMYQSLYSEWVCCRDTYHGEKAIKAKGTEYLPLLSYRQKPEAYMHYKKGAPYFNVVQQTVLSLTGSALRQDPIIQTKEDTLKDWIESVDSYEDFRGNSLTDFVRKAIGDVILLGRVGVWVD